MCHFLHLCLALALITLCRPALADPSSWPQDSPPASPEPDSPWEARPWALEAHTGFGTPVGLLGFTANYAVAPALSLGAGFGFGSGLDNASPHAALYAHLRPVRGQRNAWIFDAAYSVGGYKQYRLDLGMGHSGPEDERDIGADVAHWAQFGTGWERRAKSGFIVRMALGMAKLLNPGDLRCVPEESNTEGCFMGAPAIELPYIELALGTTL